jgi:hypothetical protein
VCNIIMTFSASILLSKLRILILNFFSF